MLNLLKFLKGKDLFLTILSSILIFVQTLSDVTQIFLLAFFLQKSDDGEFAINKPDHFLGGIGGLAGIMMACILIGLISQTIAIVISSRVGVRLGSVIRRNLLKKIQSLSNNDIDKFTTSSLINRLTNDVLFFQNTLIISLRIALRSFLLIIGGIVGIFILGSMIHLWWIGFIFLSMMILVILSIYLILKKSIPYFKKQQIHTDLINGVMRENLLGIKVVKAFNMQQEQMEKFDIKNNELKKVSITANRLTITIIPLVFFIIQFASVVIMMVIASVSSGLPNDVNVTIILQIIQLTALVVLGFILIIGILIQWGYTKSSIDRINEVFYTNDFVKNNSNNLITKPNIVFDNVSFKYNDSMDSTNVLNNITFEAKPGETIGIIGSVGSGKTTLINLITGLYSPTNGNVFISDINVKDINYDSLRESISLAPQKSVLFYGTIASNIKIGKQNATMEEMENAANIAQATEFINQKEKKFDHVVEQRGNNLSGGQKQRVSIARAIISNAKILILDDCTSALDAITESKIQKEIKSFNDKTVIVVAQRVNNISHFDKIIVLDKGEMVGYGNHKHLINNCSVYKEIAISQGVEV